MFTALMVTVMLSSKPALHELPLSASSLRCEGPDQVRVREVDGVELGRWRNSPACTLVRCEGADFVRRTLEGRQVERWAFSPRCMPTEPVRLTKNEPVRFGLTAHR